MINIEGITIGELLIAGASLMAIWKFIQWIWTTFVKPREDTESDIASIKKDLTEIKAKLQKDFDTLNEHDRSINELARKMVQIETDSQDIHRVLRVIVVAEQAVTKSLLEGDNEEGLRHAQKELNDYLSSKV